MRGHVHAWVVGCAIAAATTFAATASAATPGPNGRIVFTKGDIVHGLFTMDPNGAALSHLDTGRAFQPQWSPDGERLAFVDQLGRLVVTAADGTAPQPVGNLLPMHFAWSPDATRFALVMGFEGHFHLFVAQADGTGLQRLTDDPVEHLTPSWSPDGEWIAFTSGVHPEYDIHLIRPDGTGRHAVIAGPDNESDPDWSPDGTRLAYAEGTTPSPRIMVAHADGTGAAPITLGGNQMPAWSPDGTKIVHQVRNFGIFTMNADGTGKVWTGNDQGSFPHWGTRPPVGGPAPELPECADGVDNDGDGRTDEPFDPGCGTYADDHEASRGGSFSCRSAALRFNGREHVVANGGAARCLDDEAEGSPLTLGSGVPSLRIADLEASTDLHPQAPFDTAPAAGDRAAAAARAGTVTLNLGLLKIVATGAESATAMTCGGAPLAPVQSDSSSVGTLRINDVPIRVGTAPMTLPLGVGTLRLNYAARDQYGVTRRAIWLRPTNGGEDVIVAESHASISPGVCDLR